MEIAQPDDLRGAARHLLQHIDPLVQQRQGFLCIGQKLFAIDGEPMCVCDIAALLGMTKSAVSHQLKVLRQSDLIKYRKSGKNVFYTLADDHVRDIIEKALEHIRE